MRQLKPKENLSVEFFLNCSHKKCSQCLWNVDPSSPSLQYYCNNPLQHVYKNDVKKKVHHAFEMSFSFRPHRFKSIAITHCSTFTKMTCPLFPANKTTMLISSILSTTVLSIGPWLVSTRSAKQHLCSFVILTPSGIITAPAPINEAIHRYSLIASARHWFRQSPGILDDYSPAGDPIIMTNHTQVDDYLRSVDNFFFFSCRI